MFSNFPPRLGKELAVILRISSPLKAEYAKIHDLNYEKLLDSTEYKENYRASMVKWGEEKRRIDQGYFCRKVEALGLQTEKPIWIVSDIRRKTDIKYFEKFENFRLRIQADEDIREKRGWKFTQGIDDSETEVDLDFYENWDYILKNNGDMGSLNKDIEDICRKLISRVENEL